MTRRLLIHASCFSFFLVLMASCQETREERFSREAREYTERNCPQRITPDGTILLDSIVYLNTKSGIMVYYYTINAEDKDVVKILDQQETLRQQMLTNIRNSVELKHVKATGLTLQYIYHTAYDKRPVLQFDFTSQDYH